MRVNRKIHCMWLFIVLIVFNAASPCFAKSENKNAPAASLFVDDKGVEWIRIPREGGVDELVKLSEANEKDILSAFNNFDFKSIPMQSIKQFGPEYIKFSSALLIVQMSMCFGTTSSLSNLSMVASPASPACLDDFLAHLTDWKGVVGFYFFMLGNRYTSTGLMKIATLSLAYAGKPRSIPEFRKKITPLLGYLGMTGGSLASQVVHHFLSAPSWGECISLLKEEGLGSLPCKQAFTHFLTVEDFWDDFAAGTMSMIGATAAATVTHKILASNAHLLKNAPAMAARGIRLVGGSSKALELVAKHGSKAITGLRVVKNMTVATGVPGVMVFVVTELGQFVLFLAWDEVFRNPVARAYYDWETSGGVRENIDKIIESAKENQKLKWEKPYVVTTKVCRGRRYNSNTKRVESHCTESSVDPLMASILEFNYGAQRYRKKVLLNPVETAIASWNGKMSGAIVKYKFTKSLIEHLGKEREKNSGYAMSLAETGYYILTLWKNALDTELERHPKIPPKANPLVMNLANALGVSYASVEIVPIEETPARTNFITIEALELMKRIEMTPSKQTAVLNALTALQAYSQTGIERDVDPLGLQCSFLPVLCLARDTTLLVDLKQTFEASVESTNAELATSLFQVFGDELASEITWELLCGHGKKLTLKNTGANGRKAFMSLPALLNFERSDYQANCYDHSTLRDKFDFVRDDDVIRPWIMNGRIYKNALDLLASKNTRWTVGTTRKDITEWWMKSAFKPFATFLFDMAKQYQSHLEENLFTQIDDVTPEQLVHMSTPQMRGGALDHHIVSMSGVARPSLAVSLMSQVNFVLDTVKYYGPKGADFKKIDLLRLAYARYILGVKVAPNINSMEAVWRSYEGKAIGADAQSVVNAQEEFDENLKETIMSKEKLAYKISMRKEILRLQALIYEEMTGQEYGALSGLEKMALRIRFATLIEDVNEYKSLTAEEQKIFATFIMVPESLNNITMEIDKLYDKLGAKPFTGM